MADSIIQQFEQLAKVKDVAARSLLIRKLTAEYSRRSGTVPSDVERQLFSALVLDLYDQIDISVRRDIITLLARTSHISAPLAERLSKEKDDMVTPLFQHSPMLSDGLLIAAVRERGEVVLNAIASRNIVREELVEAIMARAFLSVIAQLLRNLGAEFSNKAVMLCSIICQKSLEIQAELAARCIADEVFFNMLNMRVENGCPFLPSSLAQAVEKGTLESFVNAKLHNGPRLVEAAESVSREETVVQINLGEITFDALLLDLINKRKKDDIIWFLRDAPGLSSKAMEHLLMTEGNKTLYRILGEQDVSVKTFEALMQWRIEKLGLPRRHQFRDVEEYRQQLRHHASR